MDTNECSKQRCVYIAHEVDRLGPVVQSVMQEKLPDVKVVSYRVSRPEWRIDDFEDDAFASKVEIVLGSPAVLGKYKHRLTGLKWFHMTVNGIESYTKSLTDVELQTPTPYLLTRNQGFTNSPHSTEYIIGQILARERFFFEAKASQNNKEWKRPNYAYHREMSSLTIGILGIGGMGQHLARACKTFEMTVWGLTRKPRQEGEGCPYVDVHRTQDNLAELLENCDYIVSALPSTNKTRDMLSGDILSHCKEKKSIFINVGRGDVVGEESLIKALRNGWLGGAILDVFEKEPLSPTSPLWDLPGVTITPHISAFNWSGKFYENVAGFIVDNYHRYINGEPLQGMVDLKEGY